MKKLKITVLAFALTSSYFLCSCGGNDEGQPQDEEVVTEQTGLNGVWGGTGTSSLFPSPYAVTFDLTDNEGTLSGEFYINSITNAGFGGSDDGSFNGRIQGDSLINVTVTQTLDNLDCPGVFEGSGVINDKDDITIFWTGTDCSGFHDNGIFRLKRR